VASLTSIQIKALVKSHGDKRVIHDFHLTVADGEFVAIVGPSGCGKTTLLQILSGVDEPNEGLIAFGKPHARVGVVFQNPRLLPWRTVRENLEIVMECGENPENLIQDWMKRVQLPDALDVYPEQLSVGMMRRVALARAFAIVPDLLLMDEPLVSLDAPTARKMRELLLDLWAERPHTVIFVTHDIREAIELSDRLVFVSAAPMRTLADIQIPIARGERTPDQIEALIGQLKRDQPEIDGLI
jgi:NitT/TauT family transport system ATP-binding protein